MLAAHQEAGTADVTLVIGANGVVNPAARTNKASPIYGNAQPVVGEAIQHIKTMG